MSDTITPAAALIEDRASPQTASGQRYGSKSLYFSLLLCVLVAVLTRVWLIVHTHGVMDGDEATVGIQAEHILRGELPVYYYSQAYLGSLQAYVIAFIFLFTGPTVWAMRVEPTLTSLLIVYLTWRFSLTLVNTAQVSGRARTFFVTIATLVAAFAPLYDVVEEIKVTGGYIEAFAIMLWLLWCAFCLTQRWMQQVSRRELVWRWAALGFLIGLGLWIDPMVVYAYAAIALWIGGYFLLELRKRSQQAESRSRKALCKEALLSIYAFPTALVGFTPGLIWGAQHNWDNIRYIFQNSSSGSGSSLHMILKVQEVYVTCLAPRAMGGALSTQPDVTPANPHILTFGLIVVGCSVLLSAGAILFSFIFPQRFFTCMRQLTLLPMLFLACVSSIFCISSISIGAIYSGCGPVDYVGRYVVALVVCLPFFVAAACILPLLIFQEKQDLLPEDGDTRPLTRPGLFRMSWLTWIQGALLIILALYFGIQGIAYAQADPQYTFHPTGCVAENPTDVTPLIAYMQHSDIHYAWASSWIGNRITFETNGAVIATDFPGRLPANSQAVLRQDRPSIVLLVQHSDAHPAFLQLLDANHVTYHVARFFSEPGIDVVVVTPLNRTVSPLDPTFAPMLNKSLIGCL